MKQNTTKILKKLLYMSMLVHVQVHVLSMVLHLANFSNNNNNNNDNNNGYYCI